MFRTSSTSVAIFKQAGYPAFFRVVIRDGHAHRRRIELRNAREAIRLFADDGCLADTSGMGEYHADPSPVSTGSLPQRRMGSSQCCLAPVAPAAFITAIGPGLAPRRLCGCFLSARTSLNALGTWRLVQCSLGSYSRSKRFWNIQPSNSGWPIWKRRDLGL